MLLLPGKRHLDRDLRIGAAYLSGAVAGSLLTALAVWACSGVFAPLPSWLRAGLIAAAAALAWMIKEGPLRGRFTLPENQRQIPAEVLGGSLVRGAMQFGFEMGTGLRTYVPSPAPYVLAAAVMLGGLPFAEVFLIALGFGAGRAIPLMLQLSAGERSRFSDEFLRGSAEFGPSISSALVLGGAFLLV